MFATADLNYHSESSLITQKPLTHAILLLKAQLAGLPAVAMPLHTAPCFVWS